jgi:hypothetical protein
MIDIPACRAAWIWESRFVKFGTLFSNGWICTQSAQKRTHRVFVSLKEDATLWGPPT